MKRVNKCECGYFKEKLKYDTLSANDISLSYPTKTSLLQAIGA